MDPLTAATTFATIVQLLGLYRQEKGARDDLRHSDFINWLQHHRHDEIKELITNTYHLQAQVDELLRQDHAEIIAKLDSANRMLTDILSHVQGFAPLTKALVPNLGLSEDAVAIVSIFFHSGVRRLIKDTHGKGQLILDGLDKAIQLDPRFLDSDLDALVAHGLISPEHYDRFRMYQLTRAGAAFAKMLPTE